MIETIFALTAAVVYFGPSLLCLFLAGRNASR